MGFGDFLKSVVLGAIIGAAAIVTGGLALGISAGTMLSSGGFMLAAGLKGALAGAASYGMGMLSEALAPDMPEMGHSSNTYASAHPVLTVQEGTPIAEAYGLGDLAGNVIRQNDPDGSSYIKLLIAHGKGEFDEFLSTFVNDVEFNDFKNSNHAKWHHEGDEAQSGVTNLWNDSETCNFRGLALTELKIKKGDEVSQVSNMYQQGRFQKCLEIGQNSGGAESWTRNPAQIMWHWYVTKEGYTTSTLDTNAFTALEAYCGTLITDDVYSVVGPVLSDDRVKATTQYNVNFKPKYVFDATLSTIGSHNKVSWMGTSAFNQRINFDLGDAYAVNKLILENYHNTGSETDRGVNNFVIQGSNTASDLDHTDFADGASSWTNVATGLSASEHTGSDVADPEDITFSNTTAYRYYSIKITDNHGDGSYVGVRSISLYHTGGKRYTFDYVFDTKIEQNDAKKIVWKSFNGKCIESQGKIKPVWDGAEEHDGAGGLQAKAVAHAFTMDNIVKGSISWWRLEHPNVYIINFRDKADGYKKSMVQMRDERDIAERGEVVYEETCWWIVERALAKRRCRLKHNKGRYPDYGCQLTGLPETQALEVYDRVTVTHTLPGFAAKDFIITCKDEDQHGRSVYVMEAYLTGVYEDRGFEEQPGYGSRTSNPNAPPPAIDSSDVTVTHVDGTTQAFSGGGIRVQFSPPQWAHYSYTEIWVSTNNSVYYWAGQDSDGDVTINGQGIYWDYGDTVYVKLRSVNANGVKEAMPASYHGSASAIGNVKLGRFFFGQNDLWAGNAAIGYAGTKIVIGNLEGTPKIALGASADSLTLANIAEYPGVYADGDGNLRAGGATHGLSFNVSTGIMDVVKMRVGTGDDYINIDGPNYRMRSSNYATGYLGSGFTLEPGLMEIGNIIARGMIRTSVFQKDTISAVGGNLLVMPADNLEEDLTFAYS